MILASISIGAVFSERGIINQAKESKKQHEDAVKKEEENLNELLGEYKNNMDGTGGSGSEGGDVTTPTPNPTPEVPKGPNGKPLPGAIIEIVSDTTQIEDENGNPVVVPGGFKVAEDSGNTVEEGIVVEDVKGNQFVWIPVSNINHDGTGKIVRNNGDEVEITLGRYGFAGSNGAETVVQYANTYTTRTNAKDTNATVQNFQELEKGRESTSTSTNTTAKDLKRFVESVEANHGYFIGRYEASYESGNQFGTGNDSSYYKPASRKSTANSTSSMSYVKGTLWNFVTQPQAAKLGRQMYYGNSYIESDLVNSYMWDTAILYIQSAGNDNYANKTSQSNKILKNTGETGDEVCHIFDMAGNICEWTTEFCDTSGYPCTHRGMNYSYNYNNVGSATWLPGTSNRGGSSSSTASSFQGTGFRVGLYIK